MDRQNQPEQQQKTEEQQQWEQSQQRILNALCKSQRDRSSK
jgi:hypothetical protein